MLGYISINRQTNVNEEFGVTRDTRNKERERERDTSREHSKDTQRVIERKG